MAMLLHVNGRREQVTPLHPPSFSLEELQRFVCGYMEVVTLSDGRLLVLNEEGKIDGLPYNVEATLLVADVLLPGDYIAGPAVLLTAQELGE